ncbi:hypothetical protein MHB46_11300 [Paenibacillus sp. FSL H7-0703]|uniref:hypothetical protein n=1 Tax=Paenibacillus sp. FSL H7-0703 TaxID=2921438 RepID=UPI0030F755B8
MNKIVSFYVPLGISSLIAALTHVIVNAVLARSEHPSFTLSSYAVAVSLCLLLETPLTAVRQMTTKFGYDRKSVHSIGILCALVAVAVLIIGWSIGLTPVGNLVFQYVFGVSPVLIEPTKNVFQVLTLLYILVAVRNIYQGLIINKHRTAWMTFSSSIRIIVMLIASWFLIRAGWTNDGRVGAAIFIAGILIELVVTFLEGRVLKRKLPPDNGKQTIHHAKHLLPFYLPLLYSALVLVILNPSIQAALNNTTDPLLAVASFSVALQILNLFVWFCSSLHQIVIQFYTTKRREVLIFLSFLSTLSPLLLLLLSFGFASDPVLRNVLGLEGELLLETRGLLRILAVYVAFYPWVEYFIGRSILIGNTKPIFIGRLFSVSFAILALILCICFFPGLDGKVAGIVMAVSSPVELGIYLLLYRKISTSTMNVSS